MKLFLSAAMLFFFTNIFAQHKLVKLWETDSTLKVPESVLYDAKNNVLYVSNIDGTPNGKDGKGSIGKIGLDGKIIAVDWVSGLNAPKGLGLHGNTLWVADVDELVGINITTGKIDQHVKVEGASFLNDITLDHVNGAVYVSDSYTKKVHKLMNGIVTTVLSDLEGPNGLLMYNNSLYVLDHGALLKMNNDKTLTKISDGMVTSTDGLENVKENEFLVSCWDGVIYYIDKDGGKQTLLDTRNEKSNTADIGYDSKKKIVYVPTFMKNKVVAYQLQ